MQQWLKNTFKERQRPPRESLAFVRARQDVSVSAHVLSLCLVLTFSYYCIAMASELLLLSLQGIPIKIGNILLHYWPQFLLALIGQPISDQSSLKIGAVYLWIMLWLFMACLIWMLRKYVRDFRGLRKAARAKEYGEPVINVSDYLRVSSPVWLSPQVITVHSPTALLDELQQTQEWSEHLAEILQRAPEEKRPPVTILISLSDHLTVSIMSQDGKQETIEFKNPSWNAVLAFFALQNKGEWLPRKTAENKIYGAEHGDLLALHTSRINAQVNRMAEDAGFFDEPEFEVGLG